MLRHRGGVIVGGDIGTAVTIEERAHDLSDLAMFHDDCVSVTPLGKAATTIRSTVICW
jgi:hypothetical protein